jgi:hypothetical protein
MPCAAHPKERVAGNLPKDSPIGLHGIPKETVGSDSEPFVETRPVDSSRWWNQDPLAAALPRERVTNALRIRRREHPATGAGPGFPKEELQGGRWTPRTGNDPWSTPHGNPPCPPFRSTAEEALPREDAGDSARALHRATPEGIVQPRRTQRDTVRGKLPAARPRGVVPEERPAPVQSGPGEAPCRTTPDGAARGQLPKGGIQ